MPTPADEQVTTEVAVLREHPEHQQVVQVQALHQQPVVVGPHTVLHQHLGHPTARHRLGGGRYGGGGYGGGGWGEEEVGGGIGWRESKQESRSVCVCVCVLESGCVSV